MSIPQRIKPMKSALPETGLMTLGTPRAESFRTLLAAAQIPAVAFLWNRVPVLHSPRGGSVHDKTPLVKTIFFDEARGVWRELDKVPPRGVLLPSLMRTGIAAARGFSEYMTEGAITGLAGRGGRKRRTLYFIPGGAWTGTRMIPEADFSGLFGTPFFAEEALSAEEMSAGLRRYMERSVLLAVTDPRLYDTLVWLTYKMIVALGVDIPFPLPDRDKIAKFALSPNFPHTGIGIGELSREFGMGAFS